MLAAASWFNFALLCDISCVCKGTKFIRCNHIVNVNHEKSRAVRMVVDKLPRVHVCARGV